MRIFKLFPKSISPKVNVIAWRDVGLIYYDATVHGDFPEFSILFTEIDSGLCINIVPIFFRLHNFQWITFPSLLFLFLFLFFFTPTVQIWNKRESINVIQ